MELKNKKPRVRVEILSPITSLTTGRILKSGRIRHMDEEQAKVFETSGTVKILGEYTGQENLEPIEKHNEIPVIETKKKNIPTVKKIVDKPIKQEKN